MTEFEAIASDQIRQAVKALKSTRPVYAGVLSFYEKIFIAQEDSKSTITLEPIQIPDDVLTVKTKEKLPLASMADFVIDMKASRSLFKKICNITLTTHKEMAQTAGTLVNAVDVSLEAKVLFRRLLDGDDRFFDKTAHDLKVDKKTLAFITYSSMKPSVTMCAEQLSNYLDENNHWEKGYCPICGNLPGLSILEADGRRLLNCSFCWHKWIIKRVQCPFCENMVSKNLHYFFSDAEKEYRVDVCDNCKKYIKTIDSRSANRFIYPPLELVATLHLDIKAQEMGFGSGMPLELSV